MFLQSYSQHYMMTLFYLVYNCVDGWLDDITKLRYNGLSYIVV